MEKKSSAGCITGNAIKKMKGAASFVAAM